MAEEKEMEESIAKLGKSLGRFCNHLQNSCDALKQSVDRRPIPLDSASSTFVQCLNRRVSSTGSDLNLLQSMSFDTVSFEELLGHCNEVYKKNNADLLDLEDQLRSFGYIPAEINDIEEEEEFLADSPHVSLDLKTIQDDNLFDDSLSLQSLGLSDACLATIASEANNKIQMKSEYQADTKILELVEGEMVDELMSFDGSKSVISLLKEDYESLPSYMKILASWEDLAAAIEKMNSSLTSKGDNFFQQDEIASLGLGPKGRSYLLLLVRMNRLVVETIDGSISYRVL